MKYLQPVLMFSCGLASASGHPHLAAKLTGLWMISMALGFWFVWFTIGHARKNKDAGLLRLICDTFASSSPIDTMTAACVIAWVSSAIVFVVVQDWSLVCAWWGAVALMVFSGRICFLRAETCYHATLKEQAERQPDPEP